VKAWLRSGRAAAQARNCPFGGLAQIGLEFAERHLDRVPNGSLIDNPPAYTVAGREKRRGIIGQACLAFAIEVPLGHCG
jgi:hypothetical protein